jgi:hypothetical protein
MNNNNAILPWERSDYIDVIISIMGFYVALLGIKATTEHSISIATRYLVMLIITGLAWNLYYFFLQVREEKRYMEHLEDLYPDTSSSNSTSSTHIGHDTHVETSDESLYADAFVAMILPFFLWITCFVRAHQFRSLIQEAEQEAEERGRRFLNPNDNANSDGTHGSGNENNGYDLELQLNEQRYIT